MCSKPEWTELDDLRKEPSGLLFFHGSKSWMPILESGQKMTFFSFDIWWFTELKNKTNKKTKKSFCSVFNSVKTLSLFLRGMWYFIYLFIYLFLQNMRCCRNLCVQCLAEDCCIFLCEIFQQCWGGGRERIVVMWHVRRVTKRWSLFRPWCNP